MNLQVQVFYSRELPELPCEAGGADRDLTAQIPMRMTSWKRRLIDRLSQAAEFGDKRILKSRLILLHLADHESRRFQLLFNNAFRRIGPMHH